MKTAATVATLGMLAASSSAIAPLQRAEKAVPSQYIVMFKQGFTATSVGSHLKELKEVMQKENPANEIIHQYAMEGFNGYSVRCSESILDFIRHSDLVDLVEEDQFMSAYDVQRNPPSWGLDRTSQRSLPLDGTYSYPSSAGNGIDMYTIDTGINISHNDFAGRAKWGFTAPSGASDDDRNGHGTHCSGTMAGSSYGIAKKANLFAVKVLGDLGFGTTADVIKGVEWTASQARGKKIVGNMSLGGGASTAIDSAVNAAVNAGVFMAVAAGNDNRDACNYSPARAELAVCVGATENTDRKSSFSNYGSCVDIHAPGTSITSAWVGSNSASRTISGTSMASPHVAGVMAIYLSEGKEPTKSALQSSSTKDAISGLPSGTVNYLLYSSESGNDDAPIEADPVIYW